MPIYRFVESGTFSVLVEVEAPCEEEALELIEDGQGVEVEGSLEYYDPDFQFELVTWSDLMTVDDWRKLKDRLA